ncbi:MAG: hypothetical protein JOZ32_12015 [Bryobacterales bacterium]|nr:hypothetical protein [Bryobacterales bacterium]
MSHMNLLESEAACLIFLANRETSLERLPERQAQCMTSVLRDLAFHLMRN